MVARGLRWGLAVQALGVALSALLLIRFAGARPVFAAAGRAGFLGTQRAPGRLEDPHAAISGKAGLLIALHEGVFARPFNLTARHRESLFPDTLVFELNRINILNPVLCEKVDGRKPILRHRGDTHPRGEIASRNHGADQGRS